jgi:putative transposase
MGRGVARMPVFFDDNDRQTLLREIEAQVQLGVLIVHAFCLMLNHIHLLCDTPFAGLGRIMHDILGNCASGFNLIHHRAGHLWQGRYKAIAVQDGHYLRQCSRYIHLNPYKAGIDPDFRYPWSSYHSYRAESSFPWVVTNRILDYFPDRLQYQMFVEDPMDDCRNPFEMATAGIVYGDKEFVKRIYAFSKKAYNWTQWPLEKSNCDLPPLRCSSDSLKKPSSSN